eukprot:s5677_g2.t1
MFPNCHVCTPFDQPQLWCQGDTGVLERLLGDRSGSRLTEERSGYRETTPHYPATADLAPNGDSLLHAAAWHGQSQVAQMLLARDHPAGQPSWLTLACEGNGHTQAKHLPERCALPTLDLFGACPDASLKLVVLWIVRPQDVRPAEAGRFVFGQALGKGQSSHVMEVTDTSTGRQDLVAKFSEKHELLQEAMVLKALQGLDTFPDFIGLFTGDQPEPHRFLVLQRFQGSLEDLRKDADPIDLIPTVGIQVLAQLQTMHQLNLAHGDLKTKNMAVASVKPLKILGTASFQNHMGKKQDFAALERHVRLSAPALADALTRMAWICRNLGMEEEPPYTELQNLLESGLPS